MIHIKEDERVPFAAFYVTTRPPRRKELQRRFVADHARTWLALQKKRGAQGAVMVDIDDTLINGKEAVANGFEFMKELYDDASLLYPVHIVTARPDDNHARVMRLLRDRGFSIPPDRLHMLPEHLYGEDLRHVEEFKWKCFCRISQQHGGVVARFGDKMWDVAHLRSLDPQRPPDKGGLDHVPDSACYLFSDPALGGTLSAKLPG
jgi:hypothetical protein